MTESKQVDEKNDKHNNKDDNNNNNNEEQKAKDNNKNKNEVINDNEKEMNNNENDESNTKTTNIDTKVNTIENKNNSNVDNNNKMNDKDKNISDDKMTGTTSPNKANIMGKQRRISRRRQRLEQQRTFSAVDLPPPVASPMYGRWSPRNCVHRTPQRVATLLHPKEERRESISTDPQSGNSNNNEYHDRMMTPSSTSSSPSGSTSNNAATKSSSSSSSNDIAKNTNNTIDSMRTTTTAPCNPILVQEQFLVSVTNTGIVCRYDPTYLPPQESTSSGTSNLEMVTRPTSTLSLDTDASIISLTTPPPTTIKSTSNRNKATKTSKETTTNNNNNNETYNDIKITNSNNENFVDNTKRSRVNDDDDDDDDKALMVVLSVEGDVYLITSSCSKEDRSLQLYHSWNTGMCGSTCVSIVSVDGFSRPSNMNSTNVLDTTSRKMNNNQNNMVVQWRVFIGYTSGYVEEWAILVPIAVQQQQQQQQQRNTVTSTTTATKAEARKQVQLLSPMPMATTPRKKNDGKSLTNSRPTSQLVWRGTLDRRIRSIAPLRIKQIEANQEQEQEQLLEKEMEEQTMKITRNTIAAQTNSSRMEHEKEETLEEKNNKNTSDDTKGSVATLTMTPSSSLQLQEDSPSNLTTAVLAATTTCTTDTAESESIISKHRVQQEIEQPQPHHVESQEVDDKRSISLGGTSPNTSHCTATTAATTTSSTTFPTATRNNTNDTTIPSPTATKNKTEAESNNNCNDTDEELSYLLITLQSEGGTTTMDGAAAMVEVIDIDSTWNAWKILARRDTTDATASDKNRNKSNNTSNTNKDVENNNRGDDYSVGIAVPLKEHWVLPAAGMEFINASTLTVDESGRLPRRIPMIPSHGTDCTACCSSRIPNSSFDPFVSCGVALSDGTVALVTATARLDYNSNFDSTSDSNDIDKCYSKQLSWGIAKDEHQLLLSYPCIGCGFVEYQGREHFVCSLRGGTVYLIPLLTKVVTNNNSAAVTTKERTSTATSNMANLKNDAIVTVISYPHDVDDGGRNSQQVFQFLQGFCAGNLYVRKNNGNKNTTKVQNEQQTQNVKKNNDEADDGDEKELMSVLVFSWPGGIIDVYSCNFFPQNGKSKRATPSDDDNDCGDTMLELPSKSSNNVNNKERQPESSVEMVTGKSLAISQSSLPARLSPTSSLEKEEERQAQQVVLQELIDNGSLQLLWDLFETMDESNELLKSKTWQEARDEYSRFKVRSSSPSSLLSSSVNNNSSNEESSSSSEIILGESKVCHSANDDVKNENGRGHATTTTTTTSTACLGQEFFSSDYFDATRTLLMSIARVDSSSTTPSSVTTTTPDQQQHTAISPEEENSCS